MRATVQVGVWIRRTLYNVSAKSTSTKLILLSSSFFAYLVFTFFACDLIAGMTTETVDIPIRSFQDVLDRGYHVITKVSSSDHAALKGAEKGSAMHKVYYNTMHGHNDKLLVDSSDLLRKITTEEKTLLWSSGDITLGSLGLFETLQLDETKYTQTGWGIQMNSEYSELLNYWLHHLDQTGIKDRMWQEWTYERHEEFTVSDAECLGYDNIAFPFFILAGATFISLALCLWEKIFRKIDSLVNTKEEQLDGEEN